MIKFLFVLFLLLFSPIELYASSGSVSYENFKRLNIPKHKSEDISWLAFDADITGQYKDFSGFMSLSGRYYYATDDDYMVSLPEGYIQYSRANTNIKMGRQLLDWSPYEKFWGLRDLNGRQGFSLLEYQQEGLVGLNISHRVNNFVDISIFGSSIYIPTVNPSYEFNNGEMSSRAEWVKLPPEMMYIHTKDVPIYYNVERPSLRNIILEKSLGAKLTLSWNRGRVYHGDITGFTLYKPENLLRNHAEGRLSKDLGRVIVTAHPKPSYHLLYGVYLNQKLPASFYVGGGVFGVDPNGDLKADLLIIDPITIERNRHHDFDAEYFKIEQDYERKNHIIFQAGVDRRIFDISFNYIHSITREKNAGDFFGDPVKWKQAMGVLFTYNFSDKFSGLFDFKYDLRIKDTILKMEGLYTFRHRMSFGFGAELLKAPNENSYWSSYRSNDTIYTKLTLHY